MLLYGFVDATGFWLLIGVASSIRCSIWTSATLKELSCKLACDTCLQFWLCYIINLYSVQPIPVCSQYLRTSMNWTAVRLSWFNFGSVFSETCPICGLLLHGYCSEVNQSVFSPFSGNQALNFILFISQLYSRLLIQLVFIVTVTVFCVELEQKQFLYV